MSKAPIYKEENVSEYPELFQQLVDAVEELGLQMKATVPIKRAHRTVGFGVSKTKRGIAVDAIISIAKAIKSQKGW